MVETLHVCARDCVHVQVSVFARDRIQSIAHTKHTFYPCTSPKGRDLNCRMQLSRTGPACQDQNIVTGIFSSRITTHTTFNLSFAHTASSLGSGTPLPKEYAPSSIPCCGSCLRCGGMGKGLSRSWHSNP